MKKQIYWGKAIVSFLLVLFLMPLGHTAMILMEKFMSESALHVGGFMLGVLGVILMIWGIFVKGDTKQTLFGLFGGIFFWTGWIEFLLLYYARRFGTMCELEDGALMSYTDAVAQGVEIATKPEYLILPSSFGFWAMFLLFYLFSIPTGCNFINWCQKVFLERINKK